MWFSLHTWISFTERIKWLFSWRRRCAITVPQELKLHTLAYYLGHIHVLYGSTFEEVLQHFISILSWKNSPYFLCVLLSYIFKHKTNRHSFNRAYLSLPKVFQNCSCSSVWLHSSCAFRIVSTFWILEICFIYWNIESIGLLLRAVINGQWYRMSDVKCTWMTFFCNF